MLKVKHIMTKGYNSRANGAVERFNKTLMHIVKKKVALPVEWDDQLPYAIYAYNSIAHKTTGDTPYFLMTGRDPQGPLIMEGEDADGINYSDMEEYKCVLTQELLKAQRSAKEHARREWEEHKRLFDLKHKVHNRRYPEPGSRVLVEIPSEKLGAKCPKLVNKWKGPYRVISVSENSATVRPVMGNRKETLIIPFDNLRVIPVEMKQEVIIETTKGRAGVKEKIKPYGDVGSDIVLNLEIKHDNYFSEILFCRCPTPCQFFPADAQKAKTTSPVQLHRMHQWLEHNPALAANPKDLQVLSKQHFPGSSSPPSLDTIRALAWCPTIIQTLSGVPMWVKAWNSVYSDLARIHLKRSSFENKLWIVTTPGVDHKAIPLSASRLSSLSESADLAKMVTDVEKEKPTAILLVVPFRVNPDELGKKLISELPGDVRVAVVCAPTAIEDYSVAAELEAMLQCMASPEKPVHLIPPQYRVQSSRNRKLWEIGDSDTIINYWQAVLLVAKEQEVPIELKLRMEEGNSVSKPVVNVCSTGLSNEAEKEAPKASKRNRPPNNHHGQPQLATGPMLSKRGRGVPVAIGSRRGNFGRGQLQYHQSF
uniref:Integrase n=1 Tax=Caenorhabditis japonica TaxID=281687 RepID=A0A8R1IVF5_CAEJA